MTFDGTGYGIAWAQETVVSDRPHVFFARLTAEGAPRGSRVQISSNPDDIGAWTTGVAWNGSEYFVVFEDQRHVDGDLIVRRITSAGVPRTPEIFLFDDDIFSSHPSLVWGNNEWAVAWEDNRYMHRDPWFRRIGRTECAAP